MTASDFGYGQEQPQDWSSEFNKIAFLVRQMIARLSTMKLVQVKAVHSNGAVAAAGTVDVLPLVNQIDGGGFSTPHGTVFGLPWWRLQGGLHAVICDPKVDDIGYVVCADRDISNVKTTKAQANPGSLRRYDLADGIYVGGLLNAAPTTYILFTDDGHIRIVDVSGNVLETSSNGFSLTGKLAVTGDVAITGAITATGGIAAGQGGGDSVTLQGHLHTSAAAGNPTTAPTAGT